LIATSFLALVGISLLGWAWCSSHRVFYPPRQPTVAPSAPPHTTRTLRASDGASFDVWLLETPNPRGRILLCHGYYASRGQALAIADGLRQRGFEALLMELRGHGDRPGPCTLGAREAGDALIALAWARSRPGAAAVPCGVLGLSMGAAVVCQAAARDAEISAVVADSPYARFFPVLRQSIRERYSWAGLCLSWLTWWAVQAVLRRRLAPMDPVTLARRLRQPMLAIQGGEDRRVAPALGQEFFDAWAGPKERWFEPAVVHVGMSACHPEEYHRRVAEFFTRTLA
jgi:fermentation-respiration switch protein FrsA (DUF1100 family)